MGRPRMVHMQKNTKVFPALRFGDILARLEKTLLNVFTNYRLAQGWSYFTPTFGGRMGWS